MSRKHYSDIRRDLHRDRREAKRIRDAERRIARYRKGLETGRLSLP